MTTLWDMFKEVSEEARETFGGAVRFGEDIEWLKTKEGIETISRELRAWLNRERRIQL